MTDHWRADRTRIKGKGNPVLCSINRDSYVCELDRQILYDRNILACPEILQKKGFYGFDHLQSSNICKHLTVILVTLIDELYIFSHTGSERKAKEHYSTFFLTQFIPALFELKDLVFHPMEMSEETRDTLKQEIYAVYLNFIDSRIKKEKGKGKADQEIHQEETEGFAWFNDVLLKHNLLQDYGVQDNKVQDNDNPPLKYLRYSEDHPIN